MVVTSDGINHKYHLQTALQITLLHGTVGSSLLQILRLGITYQMTLFYGPKALLVLVSFVMFLVMAIILCKDNRNQSEGGQRNPYKEAIRLALPLLFYLVLYNIIVGVMIANRADYAIAIAHDRKPYYPLFLAHAISDPMRILFIPVAFLLHPGTLRKLLRKDSQDQQSRE